MNSSEIQSSNLYIPDNYSNISAIDPLKDLSKGLIKIINEEVNFLNMENSGLLTDRITSIAIDSNGYKWVGLFKKGISKFK